MKILIAYDGSPGADAILPDLALAGLPEVVEAQVMTVRDMPPAVAIGRASLSNPDEKILEYFRKEQQAAEIEAHQLADKAAARLRSAFPKWSVDTHSAFGSPHRQLIEHAAQWKADLVVVGSRGRGALARTLLGSVALACLHHCPCSVRICRPPAAARNASDPPRLLLATDGSEASKEARQTIETRRWPKGTTVRVLCLAEWTWLPVDDLSMPLPSISHDQMLKEVGNTAAKNAKEAADALNRAGIDATPFSYIGYPRRDIVDEAEHKPTDTIFLGAVGHNLLERVLVGSVAASVATQATCTIEIVRPRA